MTEKCPGCGATNTTDKHLLDEYSDLMRHTYGMFGRNADRARIEVAEMLLARGITHLPNIFGDIALRTAPTQFATAADRAEARRQGYKGGH